MLIINLSGLGLASVFGSASAVGCWLVVIRIAAYRNRFSKWFYACFDYNNHPSTPT